MKFNGSCCPWAPCLVFVQPEGSPFDLLHHVTWKICHLDHSGCPDQGKSLGKCHEIGPSMVRPYQERLFENIICPSCDANQMKMCVYNSLMSLMHWVHQLH